MTRILSERLHRNPHVPVIAGGEAARRSAGSAARSSGLLHRLRLLAKEPLAKIALVLGLLLIPLAAHAVRPDERLADPALEARARDISGQLRCLVCQNESIDESDADLAHDIRIFVRQRLTAGDTNQQAIAAVVDRYGQFVLLKPPVEPATYVLWYGPIALLVLGGIGIVVWMRGHKPPPVAATPLSADETANLDRLLRENDV